MPTQKPKIKVFFKRLFCFVFALVFLFGALAVPMRQAKAQIITTSPLDTAATIGESIEQFFTTQMDNWRKGIFRKTATTFLLKAIDNFAQKMAQKIAVGIATGAKGGKPLAFTKEMGSYLKDSADAAAGDYIEALSKEWKVDLCKPDLSVKAKFGLALYKLEKPDKPKCTFSEMKKNWNEAVNDPDLLKNFSVSFEPQESEIGGWLLTKEEIEHEKELAKAVAEKKRGNDAVGGTAPKTNTISGDVTATASKISKISDKEVDVAIDAEEKKTNIATKMAEDPTFTSIAGKFFTTIGKTLANEVVKNYLAGTYSAQDVSNLWKDFCDKNPALCGKNNSLSNPNAQNTSGGKQAAEAQYSKYIKTNLSEAGNYDVLPELSSCDDSKKIPGPTTCVIDSNFVSAIQDKLTVKEAIEKGLLDGNKVVGYKTDGKEITYLEGYPYRSLAILRKYRIIPVGWELAAQYFVNYGGGSDAPTLNGLIDAYNDTNSPYYRLVDPNWVLKLPSGYCKVRGAGPEIIFDQITPGSDSDNNGDWEGPNDLPPSKTIVRNDQYCADEQSCIKEDIDGNCKYYGYCMEEKRLWKFDGDACDEINNTCQAFAAPNGESVSYLKNSLDWDDCSKDNSGCQWYCNEFNPKENSLTSDGAVAYWSMDKLISGGTKIEDEAGNNDGSLKGNTALATGKWGKALSFDGAGDYIQMKDSLNLSDNSFTFSHWIKTTNDIDLTQVYTIGNASSGNGYRFGIDNGKVAFLIGKTNEAVAGQYTEEVCGTIKVNDKNWHFITGVFDRSKNVFECYVDGIKDNSVAIKSYIGMSDIAPGIGAPPCCTDFNGLIDEVSIYNRALSGDEIWNDYISYNCLTGDDEIYLSDSADVCEAEDAGCNEYLVPENGLVGYWKFDKGEGLVAYDSSGYGDDGVLINDSTSSGTADNGSITTLVDAILTQADDYWNGWNIIINTTTDGGAPKGEIAVVTDFDSATDTLIFAALTAKVDAGDTYTLTLNGPTWTLGQSGQALSFDGTDDYVDAGDVFAAPQTELTVSAWVFVDKFNESAVADTSTPIVSNWNNFVANQKGFLLRTFFGFDSNTMFWEFNVCDNDDTYSTVFYDILPFNDFNTKYAGQWLHIVGTYKLGANNLKFYINGRNASSVEGPANMTPDVASSVWIAKTGVNLNYFNGVIDEVAIYNRALSEQEISSLYKNGINFSDKYVKAANKNLQCFGRTSGDAVFDLPPYVDNCISLGSRYDSYGYDSCFEFLSYKNETDCAANNGVWSSLAIKIPRHTVQTYCEKSGGVWTGALCQTQCLKLDDAECASYAFSCKSSELGCEKYTPTSGGSYVPGVISDDDLCPSECAGYDTYKQESTNFETSKFPVNFIPKTAMSCASNNAGCDEFTNLEAASGGGESLEYYTYLRQCEKIPTTSAGYQCGDFYTWVGSDATGYQLQSYYLKSTGIGSAEKPMEILRVEEYLGECDDGNDALTNKNCKEFYNSEGVISYHLLKKTITCSDDCINYRKTAPAEFDLKQICKNIKGTWNLLTTECDITSEEACKAINGVWIAGACSVANIATDVFCANANYLNAVWDAVSSVCSKTDYSVIPAEGVKCQSSANGCRQYTGNVGGNVMNVFNDNFESDSYIYDFPDAGRGWLNGSLSSESTDSDQKSFKVNSSGGGTSAISKWLSAKCSLASTCAKDAGCDCLETVALNDGVDDDEVVCKVAIDNDSCYAADYTYNKGMYLLSFWAKGNKGDDITIKITDGASDQDFGNVTLSSQWQEFTLGPLEFDVEGWNNYQLSFEGIKSDGGTPDSALGAFFDNIKLQAISDSIYVIKDSWITPAVCDQDWQGNSYLYYMLGCDEYSDTQGALHYLKSFTNLCRVDAVGCQKLIDTYNFSEPFGKTWNVGDKSEITVPTRTFVYLAQTQAHSCMSSSVGCAELGKPVFNQDQTIVKGFDVVYKINDPDYYDISLCLEKNVGCQTFASGSGDYYFKDPGEKVCEYVQPTYQQDFGWYQKSDSYDINSKKCPTSNYQNLGVDFPSGLCIGGVENGKNCLSAQDNQLEDRCIGGGGSCNSGLCVLGTETGKSCLSKCSAGGGYCGNWAGACVASQSGCGAFVDPISDISVSLITNGLFNKDLAPVIGVPDNWDNAGGGMVTFGPEQEYVDAIYVEGVDVFSQSPIDIKPNTTYVVSSDIKQYLASADNALIQVECLNYADGFSGCPSDKDTGFYFIDEAGELDISLQAASCGIRLEDRARLIIPANKLSADFSRYSMRFFSGTCNKAQVAIGGMGTTGQSFDNVSLREAGDYYYIDSSLGEAKQECNGYVNSDNGCVLLNDRNNASLSSLNFTNYLNYNADKMSSAATSCVGSDGSKFACNADTLMKVRPDRDCNKWLYCTEKKDDKYCSRIEICDKMNKNGKCVSSPLEYSQVLDPANMTFDIASADKIKNLSGYSKAGFDWIAGGTIEGNLPPSQMKVIGLEAVLSNGDFELAVKDPGYSRKPIGWDVYECSVSGAACDFDADCPGGEVCEGNWEVTDFGLVNNPIEQQKISIEPVSGKNILRLTAGSKGGEGHALSEDVYVNISADYILSAYINTRDLVSLDETKVYGAIRVLDDNIAIAEEKIESGSNGWEYVQTIFKSTSGKVKVKLADVANFSEDCDEDCIGKIYFDNISIRPSIGIDELSLIEKKYTPMSCRLFPQSEAMSCEYENEDGYKYKGWYGYCLEHDPVYPEYCLNWYPTDDVSGGDSQSMGESYDGKTPLYYCLEAKAELVYPDGWDATKDTVGPYNVFWIDRLDASNGEKIFFATYTTNYSKEIIPSLERHSIDAPDGDSWIVPFEDNIALIISTNDACDDSVCSGPDWHGFTIKDKISETIVFTWSGMVDWYLFPTFTPLKWYCSKIVRVVSDSGQNKYWASRLNNGSAYKVPGLDYSYQDDDIPFGSIIPPEPKNNPTEWDGDVVLSEKQPLFIPSSNVANPYSCNGELPGGGNACNNDWLLNPMPVAKYKPDGFNYNVNDAVERIKRLFAESYGIWSWKGTWDNGNYESDSSMSWTPPTPSCPSNSRPEWPNDYCGIPPKVENLTVNGQSFDKNEKVLISGSGDVSLRFNSVVDRQQLPLVSYIIKWGDSADNITSESGIALRDRPSINDPHNFSYEYRYATLYANKDVVGLDIKCEDNCSEDITWGCSDISNSDSSFCRVRSSVEITDNWGWTSGPVYGPFIYVLGL